MKIGIYGQVYHQRDEEEIKTLFEVLQLHDIEVVVEAHYHGELSKKMKLPEAFGKFASHKELDTSFDMFISIGGDGTILRTATFIRDTGIPILGINAGRLGFLATVQKEDITNAVKSIVNKEYSIEERSLLSITTTPDSPGIGNLNFALNEIAVSRKNTTSMITVVTYLNEEYLTSYWADGLIVATPTGSTGYSLSCGGPVITPNANSIVLTPIAPHNLNARPLVIPDDTQIKLKVSGREENYLVSLDSRIATVSNDTEILIQKTAFKVKMVQLKNESFLKTLRQKLLWGEDKRN